MHEKLIKAFKDPWKVVRELHRVYWRLYGHEGINVMAADWDNLILLDACRYDVFKDTHSFKGGALTDVTSRGSMTVEWLENNFEGKSFPDTVFISGNPNLYKIDAEFADIIRLWESDWDDDVGTARPEAMVEATLEAAEEYPNKRLISLFVQPHIPFLGPSSRKIDQHGFTGGGIVDTRDIKPVWHRLAAGDIDKSMVQNAYRENLKIVYPHLKKLISKLSGKTVISSDHGNAFGEKYVFGHPGGIYREELVRVPWMEFSGERKEITPASEVVSTGQSESDVVKNRLAELGYR